MNRRASSVLVEMVGIQQGGCGSLLPLFGFSCCSRRWPRSDQQCAATSRCGCGWGIRLSRRRACTWVRPSYRGIRSSSRPGSSHWKSSRGRSAFAPRLPRCGRWHRGNTCNILPHTADSSERPQSRNRVSSLSLEVLYYVYY